MNRKTIKNLLIGTALLLILGSEANSQAQGIRFETGQSWEQIKEKAKKENKYIFLDMYTTWCGPCRAMDQTVYATKEAGDFFNAGFVSVKVQMDSAKTDSEAIRSWYAIAQQLGRQYNIAAYPSYVFLNPQGELVNKQTGLVPVEGLIAFGNDARDPSKQYSILLNSYNKGKRNPDFVRGLVRLASQVGEKARARKMAQDYIAGLTELQMLELENIWCLYENTKASSDRGFAFFMDHAAEIAKVEPKISVQVSEGKVNQIIVAESIKPFSKSLDGKPDWRKIDSAIARYGASGQKALGVVRHDLIFDSEVLPFLDTNQNWALVEKRIARYKAKYMRDNLLRLTAFYYLNAVASGKAKDNRLMILALDRYLPNDISVSSGTINRICRMAFEKFERKEELSSAVRWAEIGLKKDPVLAGLNDTYANLLYKMGDQKKAMEWQNKAIKLDPSNHEFKENYDKMLAGTDTWPEHKP